MLQWIGHGLRGADPARSCAPSSTCSRSTTLWFDGQLLVGSKRPLRISPEAFAAKRARAETRAALDEIGLDSFETLASWYRAGPDELRRFVGEGPLLTDDRPMVEYYRSLPAGDAAVRLDGFRGDVTEIVNR